MIESKSKKYLPLKTAAELYGYTRDHLGLMIRQNKLKGMKLGSYYVTTNEWMADYIKNFADSDHPASKNKLSNKFLTEILSSKKDMAVTVNNKNIAEASRKTTIPAENTQNSALSNALNSKHGAVSSDLKRKIFEELTQYKSLMDNKALRADINQTEKIVSTSSNAPFIILPIRKMENAEREEVLKKVE